MQDPITPREFDLLRSEIRYGFEGVHSRLDRLNGKVDDHTESLSRHGEQIAVLQSEDKKGFRTAIGAFLAAAGAIIWNFIK